MTKKIKTNTQNIHKKNSSRQSLTIQLRHIIWKMKSEICEIFCKNSDQLGNFKKFVYNKFYTRKNQKSDTGLTIKIKQRYTYPTQSDKWKNDFLYFKNSIVFKKRIQKSEILNREIRISKIIKTQIEKQKTLTKNRLRKNLIYSTKNFKKNK